MHKDKHIWGINKYILLALLSVVVFSTVSGARIENVKAYQEIVVVIDPGHGGPYSEGEDEANSGARYHDLQEKDINLTTALSLRDELSQYGNVSVYMTRTDDSEVSLDDRVDYAKSVNADIIVSVHYNASADHNFFGSEIFTSAFGENYATGYGLAQCIMKEWVSYGNIEKGIKTRIGNAGTDYYGLIRHGTESNIPTIILEHGYIDNDRDFLRLDNDLAWRQMGIMDAKGIAAYYGLEKDTVKAEINPTVSIDIPTDTVKPDDTEPTGVKLEIDKYDSETGAVDFTLYAYDDESKLMYYGFKAKEADDIEAFDELELWEGNNGKMTGTYQVKPGYEGPLTAAVFNIYQLDGKSRTVNLKAKKTESKKDKQQLNDDENASEGTGDVNEAENEGIIDEEPNEPLENEKDKTITVTRELSGKKSIENSTMESNEAAQMIEHESAVENAYNKLIMVAIVFAAIIVVIIIMAISSMARKAKRRNARRQRERKSYDWIDDDKM